MEEIMICQCGHVDDEHDDQGACTVCFCFAFEIDPDPQAEELL